MSESEENYRYELKNLEKQVEKMCKIHERNTARITFFLSIAFGIGAAFCINQILRLDGSWTYFGTLIATASLGIFFTIIAALWLSFGVDMRKY